MSNPATNVSAHLNSQLTRTLADMRNYFQALSQFKLGVVSSLLTLISIHFIYICLTTNAFLILTILAIVRICMTIFLITSLYIWLTLIFSKNWSDVQIYQLFLITFLSEFVTQRLTLNVFSDELTANVSSTVLHVSIACISFFVTNLNKKIDNFIVFMIATCLTRCYGSYHFSTIAPPPVAPYISYLFAFSGCLFSHYITRCLKNFQTDEQAQTNCQQSFDNIQKAAGASSSSSSSKLVSMLSDINDLNVKNDQKRTILKSNLRRNKVSSNNIHTHDNNNNNNSTEVPSFYKRRSSLPTIPFKFEKVIAISKQRCQLLIIRFIF